MEAEIAIVGAGPAGSMAAMALAQRGHDVLLLDRQSFPRDKACGDGVPVGAVEMMKRYGMDHIIQEEVAKGHFYPVRRLMLVSPSGYPLEADFKHAAEGLESYVAPRVHLDYAMFRHALDSGARFEKAMVKAPVVENGRVVGVQAQRNGHVETIRSRVVIAADGVTSAISRALRPEQDKPQDGHRAVALRAYIEDLREIPHEVEFYLYKGILPGYAWIFPTGTGRANIGLGMRLDKFRKTKKSLEDMLRQFMEFPEIKARLSQGGVLTGIKTWQLNFGSQNIQRSFDGAVLIGDAAGLINPLTGGGIHNALISAELAAETISDGLAKGDVSRRMLMQYEKRCSEALDEGMRRSYFIQHWLLRFPRLVDLIILRAGSSSRLARIFLEKL